MKLTISDDGKFGREPSWLVTCYMDGKRIRRSFKTLVDAERYANETRTGFESGNGPGQLANAVRLCAGTGYTVDYLVKEALANIRASGAATVSPTATFGDGVRLYLAKQAQTDVRPTTLMQTKANMNSLMKVFGNRTLISITESEVEGYLALLKNREGQPGGASTSTKLRTLEYIKAVYRSMGVNNPLPSVRKPRPGIDERCGKFFSTDQFIEIMTVARPNERGMLALALIGGLRPRMLERLPADCVDMVRRIIAIPSSVSMERAEHQVETECIHPDNGSYFPGLPSVVWDWLKIFPFEPRSWGPLQRRIAAEIGFWHQDGSRNTAATYYNKLHGMAATQVLLHPEGVSRGFTRFHVGLLSKTDADRFYNINPADFLAKQPA